MKRYTKYIILAVLAGLLLWGVLWAKGKAADQVCNDVKVEIVNNETTNFVTAEGILQSLEKKHINLKGMPMWQINSEKVEKALASLPYLESVQIVKAQDGKVIIQVTQLVPVMRVFDGEASYYVNADGKKMRAEAAFYCDVPVVTGHFTKAYPPQRLIPLITYVQNDSALNSVVQQYIFRDSTNIYMVPCFVGHVVNLGSADNYENKFKKLMLFYKKVLPYKGWMTYDTISVKWSHQVVGTLRSHKVAEAIVDSTDMDETPDMSMLNDGRPNPVAAKQSAEAKNTPKPAPAPAKKAAEPAKKPQPAAAPAKKEEPAKKASEPTKKAAEPTKKAAEPAKKTSAAKPATASAPAKKATDNKATATPAKKAATTTPAKKTGNQNNSTTKKK